MSNRELDAKMAELMGKPFRKPGHGTCCTCQTCGWDYDNCQCYYSTDIAAAMQVLLKLEELEPTATIRLSNGDGDSCDVDILTDVFCELNAVHISLDGGLELLPLAICHAAEKAMEKQNE